MSSISDESGWRDLHGIVCGGGNRLCWRGMGMVETTMKRYWQYFKYVLRHKWFVLISGIKLGHIPLWMLIFHDWDKFLPSMFIPYARHFYNPDGTQAIRRDSGNYKGIEKEVQRHVHRNKHHPEYWEDKSEPIPDVYVYEMLADWIGAGLANGKSNTQEWYEANKNRWRFHPTNRALIERELSRMAANGGKHDGECLPTDT